MCLKKITAIHSNRKMKIEQIHMKNRMVILLMECSNIHNNIHVWSNLCSHMYVYVHIRARIDQPS